MPICPISVIIPTYNRAFVLQRAIDSVCNQSLAPAEIIVVDDGSTDDSKELLLGLKAKSSIPIIAIHTANHGVAAARNIGIKNSQYDIIAFLDSDDHWNRKKIEKQFQKFIKQDQYLVCHTKERWLRRGVHLNQKRKHIPRHGDIFSQCLELCAVGMSTVMVRKELFEEIGYFDESMQCCEDYDIWLRVSAKYPFLLIDEPLIVKEGGREDQLSQIYRCGMDERRIYSIEKLLSSGVLRPEHYNTAMLEFEKKIRIFANGCIKHGRVEDGEKYLNLLRSYKNKKPKVYNLNNNFK